MKYILIPIALFSVFSNTLLYAQPQGSGDPHEGELEEGELELEEGPEGPEDDYPEFIKGVHSSIIENAKIIHVEIYKSHEEDPEPDDQDSQTVSALIRTHWSPSVRPCDASQNTFYVNLGSAYGETIYHHALSAYHSNSDVTIVGTEECNHLGFEEIYEFQIHK